MASTRPALPWLPIALMGVVILLALPFAAVSVVKGAQGLGGAPVTPERLMHQGAPVASLGMFSHMIAGGLLTVLALFQSIGALRRRWPRLHRLGGRVVVVLALLTALGGLVYIALKGTVGGAGMSAGFALYGFCVGGCAIFTWRAARAGDFVRHRRWGLRMVWLAIGSWLYRVQYGAWYALTDGLASTPDFAGAFDRFMFIGFFVPHLLILEVYLRARGDIEPARQRG